MSARRCVAAVLTVAMQPVLSTAVRGAALTAPLTRRSWFTEPFAENFKTSRLSLYWSVSIGHRPHPSPKPFAHMGLLQNGNGGYQQWLNGGPARNYGAPRLLNVRFSQQLVSSLRLILEIGKVSQ